MAATCVPQYVLRATLEPEPGLCLHKGGGGMPLLATCRAFVHWFRCSVPLLLCVCGGGGGGLAGPEGQFVGPIGNCVCRAPPPPLNHHHNLEWATTEFAAGQIPLGWFWYTTVWVPAPPPPPTPPPEHPRQASA